MAAYIFPNNTASVPMGYGQYDNGANVFNLYDNFWGTTLGSQWNGAGTYTVNNGISFATSGGGTNAASSVAGFGFNTIGEAYGYLASPLSSGQSASNLGGVGFGSGGIDGNPAMTNGWAQSTINNFGTTLYTGSTTYAADSPSTAQETPSLFGLGYISPTQKRGYLNYAQSALLATSSSGTLNFVLGFQQNDYLTNQYYWVRVRTYPPNGILPATSFGSTLPITPMAFNSLTISNSMIDAGQTQTLAAYVYNGVAPYTYNVLVYNSVALVANQLATSVLTYNTFAFTQNSAWGTGTFTVNVMVTDSAASPVQGTNSLAYNVPGGGSAATSSTTTIASGGGGGPARQTLTLNDNLTSAAPSNISIFNVYITNSSGTTKRTYNQDALPATITYSLPATLNFAFACSFSSGSKTYRYAGDIYGIGFDTPCGTNYTAIGGTYTVLYSNASVPALTTSITTSTTGSSIPSTTIPTANVPVTETKVVFVESNKTVIEGFYDNQTMVKIYSSASQSLNVSLTNQTASSSFPQNYTKLSVFYLNASNGKDISLNVTEKYNCSIPAPSLEAFYLSNGNWVPIYNSFAIAQTCTITFSAPNAHTIGLFESTKQLSPTSSSTIRPATSTSTISVQPAPAKPSFPTIPVAVAVTAVALVAVIIFVIHRKHPKKKR